MKQAAEMVAALLLAIGMYFVLPAAFVWGWVRWARSRGPLTLSSLLSFIAFLFATLAGLLAVSSIIYAQGIGGFPFWDPRLVKIFGWGALLSLTAIVFAVAGVWRSNPLRWLAPVCAAGIFLFWLVAAMGE